MKLPPALAPSQQKQPDAEASSISPPEAGGEARQEDVDTFQAGSATHRPYTPEHGPDKASPNLLKFNWGWEVTSTYCLAQSMDVHYPRPTEPKGVPLDSDAQASSAGSHDCDAI